jgi:copper oxidase (laccase) domain-containing protein
MKLPEPFERAGDHLAIDLPGARAVFTTRRGGRSAGPFASLNLGRSTDDDPSAVAANHAMLQDQLSVRFAQGRQVHGTHIETVTAPTGNERPEADGLATIRRGVAAPGAIAMVHAGWRGLQQGVVAEGVRAVRRLQPEPASLTAAIGPGAGPCCYEVGSEVHAAFADHTEAHQGRNLDLKAIARVELQRAGVQTVHDVALCTICSDPSLFYSHRRDHGITGRQAGVAWLIA